MRLIVIATAGVLAGCAGAPPERAAPSHSARTGAAPSDAAVPAVVREPLPAAPGAVIPPATPAPSTAAPQPGVPSVTPSPGTLYVCLTEQAGVQRQTAIEFAPKVADLCRKHPEMGPCQYERDNCRRAGGRVFAADGKEITQLTEAEYDKRVRRVRFRAQ